VSLEGGTLGGGPTAVRRPYCGRYRRAGEASRRASG
jgi:hypothetical protein